MGRAHELFVWDTWRRVRGAGCGNHPHVVDLSSCPLTTAQTTLILENPCSIKHGALRARNLDLRMPSLRRGNELHLPPTVCQTLNLPPNQRWSLRIASNSEIERLTAPSSGFSSPRPLVVFQGSAQVQQLTMTGRMFFCKDQLAVGQASFFDTSCIIWNLHFKASVLYAGSTRFALHKLSGSGVLTLSDSAHGHVNVLAHTGNNCEIFVRDAAALIFKPHTIVPCSALANTQEHHGTRVVNRRGVPAGRTFSGGVKCFEDVHRIVGPQYDL